MVKIIGKKIFTILAGFFLFFVYLNLCSQNPLMFHREYFFPTPHSDFSGSRYDACVLEKKTTYVIFLMKQNYIFFLKISLFTLNAPAKFSS